MKKVKHLLEYCASVFFLFLLKIIPEKAAYWSASAIGGFAFYVLRIRKEVSLGNIRESFPDLPESKTRSIALHAYISAARVMVEFARYPRLKKKINDKVTVENQEYLEELARNRQGAIFIGAHLGNWEIQAAAVNNLGFATFAVAGNQHNVRTGAMMNRYREMIGIRIIRTGVNIREVVRAIQQNQFILLASDQDAGSRGVFVDFMGRPASAPQGPALFHIKTGVPLMVMLTIRQKDGRYITTLKKLPALALSGNKEDDVRNITQAYYTIIEEYVRKYPEQYFWMHRRWMTKKK